MQKSANKCIFWDLGNDLGSKNLPKWGPKSVKIDKNQSWGASLEKYLLFLPKMDPKWSQNWAKIELNLSKNWVKIEAKKKSKNLTILFMIFNDFWWHFLMIFEASHRNSENGKTLKTIIFTVYFGGTSLQKSLKIVKKLNRKSYHPKVTKSNVF